MAFRMERPDWLLRRLNLKLLLRRARVFCGMFKRINGGSALLGVVGNIHQDPKEGTLRQIFDKPTKKGRQGLCEIESRNLMCYMSLSSSKQRRSLSLEGYLCEREEGN